jgi:chemotaxis protein methyltransferase CheR
MSDERTALLFRLPGNEEFALFRDLVFRETGIFLADTKKTLLAGRLMRRLRDLGLPSFREYYELVMQNPDERVQLLDAVSTNETHFFREPRHFELIGQTLAPQWARELASGQRRQIRVWSAGCSSGEEPYSVAMTLLDALPARPPVDILATDLSTRMLARAEEALYPAAKAREIPAHHLKKFMLRGVRTREGLVRPTQEVRDLVRFRRLNFNDGSYDAGTFDLILCRNVLIYFNAETKARVVGRILRHLAPGGTLLVGHAESLTGMCASLRPLQPTVYRLSA